MLNLNFLSNTLRYTPLLVPHRWKVRILPKHYDGIYETKYMTLKKPKKNTMIDILALLHRKDLSLKLFANWQKWKKFNDMRDDQRYMPERHKFLGPDLATTHFITARGGKIKFVNNDKWITVADIDDKTVPSFYVPGFFVEEIDASGMNLCYEGFDNLSSLTKLKKLTLNNCSFVDDWCLGRTHLFANTLEYLDISGCHLITERGICALHTLKKLKTLVINDTPNIQNKELVTLLLQDIIPRLNIVGVNYDDPVFRKRIENYIN